jgi:hypothetical protein
MDIMKKLIALVFVPGIGVAGTSYDLNFRDLAQPTSAPMTSRHFVQDGTVRVDLVENRVLIFKDQALYVVDNKARTFSGDSISTRDRILARTADQVRQIRAKAATAPPDQREKMEQGASSIEKFQTDTFKTVSRAYAATTNSEMVDGHECRIWTETQEGAKRLELCVVSVDTVRGGDDILAGMKILSQYPVFGSLQALGVQFGYGEWWTGIESLGGLPVLIREFEHGHVSLETTITNVHQERLSQSLFDIPDGYEKLQPGRTREVAPAESNK